MEQAFQIQRIDRHHNVLRSPFRRSPRAFLRKRVSIVRACRRWACPGFRDSRLSATGAAGGGERATDQRFPVRLPDVRPMRAFLNRHVLSDELPEESAQWPVWWRSGWWLLRGQAADALRLGRSMGRRAAYARWTRSDSSGSAACRSRSRGLLRLAQGGARESSRK